MDKVTASMCEKRYGRANFARVLIEVEAENALVETIEVYYKSLGKSMLLDVEYTWKPPICSQCKVFGHEFDKCLSRVYTEEELKRKNDVKNMANSNVSKATEDWRTINGKRNTMQYNEQSSQFVEE